MQADIAGLRGLWPPVWRWLSRTRPPSVSAGWPSRTPAKESQRFSAKPNANDLRFRRTQRAILGLSWCSDQRQSDPAGTPPVETRVHGV
jgi:hypothetical protein